MKTLAILLLVFIVKTTPSSVSRSSWSMDFTINNAGFDVKGTMKIMQADIQFNPNKLDKSSMTVIVDPSSVETGIAIRDKHLQRSDYFDVKHHREILIQSLSLKRIDKHKYTGEFAVTIKSITRQISIPFIVKRIDDDFQYQASFTINRLDFALGEESFTLSNSVKIDVVGRSSYR
jgi:polyisoprenoid-binding protein YceI